MLHARPDYMRIQDPSGLIPQDEPVFLLRAQDATAALVVQVWAAMQPSGPLKEMADYHASRMRGWREQKWADITPEQLDGVHGQPPVGEAHDCASEIGALKRQLAEKKADDATLFARNLELGRQLVLANTALASAEALAASRQEIIESLVRLHAADAERTKEVVAERDRLLERIGMPERDLEAIRLAHAGYIADADRSKLEAANHNIKRAKAVLELDALRQSAAAAGCVEVEVCTGCGAPAPCSASPNHPTKMRLANKRAEDAERERGIWKATAEGESRIRDYYRGLVVCSSGRPATLCGVRPAGRDRRAGKGARGGAEAVGGS